MDDVRRLGDCLRYEPLSRDMSDVCDDGFGARLPEIRRGARLRDDLARMVEAEIIPRLMLSHRQEPAPQTCNILPDAEQIASFTALMLAPAGDDVEARLDDLLAGGLTPDSLLLDLLVPTARHLGLLWEEDLCDFVEVTRAMGRVQRIMREVSHRFGIEPEAGRVERSILLLPCPGEAHSFGLTLVERCFLKAGWDVTCSVSDPDDAVLTRVRDNWFDVVGLSLACDVLLPRATRMIAELRRYSRNSSLRVMVGGPAFAADPERVREVGADATAADVRQVLCIAESLLDLPVRPC